MPPKPKKNPKGCGMTPVVLDKKEEDRNECDRVITIPQYTGVCWFTSIMMSLFFSQHSRKLLLNKLDDMPLNDANVELRAILWDVMQRRYKSSYEMKDYAYMFFQVITPENILQQLHKMNPKEFEFDSNSEGYFNFMYVPRLLNFMGAKDVLMLDYSKATKNLYHSIVNAGLILTKTVENKYSITTQQGRVNPVVKPEYDVVLIYANEMAKAVQHVYKRKHTIAKTFTHNGKTYILDSMMIGNFNNTVCHRGHDICGITCEDKRYMYNGWVRHTQDASMMDKVTKRSLPCELMEYDWLTSSGDFCINPAKCSLDGIKMSKDDLKKNLCFNVNKGERLYVYVNKNRSNRDPTPKSPKTPDDVDFDKILADIKKKPKDKKECPPGKVINPKTGRCIKAIRQKPEKVCPPGKVINPKTGRCINAIRQKPEKVCPPGKVINPATGRCVKSKAD